MSIYYKTGNLLEAPVDYICHQVNCQGRMASGIAKQIRDRWPIVYEQYMAGINERRKKVEELCGQWESQIDVSETLLGHGQNIPVSDNLTVINMFAQEYYGYDGKRYTSYDAFWSCLGHIKEFVPKGSKIAFPYKIGCDRGGATWEVIYMMIVTTLGSDYDIEFCYLEKEEQQLFEEIVKQRQFSARAYYRTLKVARTIADLDDCEVIRRKHLLEALCYRDEKWLG